MAITASKARARLFPLIEEVQADQEAVEIASRKGSVFLVSADEYRSLQETAYLLPVTAQRRTPSEERRRSRRRPYRSPRAASSTVIRFSRQGWEDYTSWTDDRRQLSRINRLITEAVRDPGGGVGKPERLRGDLSGYWSRRIDHEYRLVYTVDAGDLIAVQARYHC